MIAKLYDFLKGLTWPARTGLFLALALVLAGAALYVRQGCRAATTEKPGVTTEVGGDRFRDMALQQAWTAKHGPDVLRGLNAVLFGACHVGSCDKGDATARLKCMDDAASEKCKLLLKRQRAFFEKHEAEIEAIVKGL